MTIWSCSISQERCWRSLECWWKDWHGKTKVQGGKSVPMSRLGTNSTLTELRLIVDLCWEKPMSNRRANATARPLADLQLIILSNIV
jgi:hypothetical protein